MATRSRRCVSWSEPQVGLLPDGRLHLQHGPIDLLIGMAGQMDATRQASEAAMHRFSTVLGELVAELPLLRTPLVGNAPPQPHSLIGRRMVDGCWPHRNVFITPMAAVAGSVADEIAAAMIEAAPDLLSLHVNNGGDVAVHVASDAPVRIGLIADLRAAVPQGFVTITRNSGIGGVATSGWRGRSFSLGIADAVTVLARDAATADAAATIIANAVTVEDRAILRQPARVLDPDSDLGDLQVTTGVGEIAPAKVDAALLAGRVVAQSLIDRGLIAAVALALQGRWIVVGEERALRGTGLKSLPMS